jgi:hypothetical protein
MHSGARWKRAVPGERKAGRARLFFHGALDFGSYELTSEMLLTVIVSPSSVPSTFT